MLEVLEELKIVSERLEAVQRLCNKHQGLERWATRLGVSDSLAELVQ
jgi:hypothetical protein